MSKGGDFAELYLERTRGNSISLEERKIRSAAYGNSLGMGIRVLKGTEVGYAYSDDLDPRALKDCALVAANIASGGGSPAPVRVSRKDVPNRYPVEQLPDSVAPKEKVALLERGDEVAHAFDSRIIQVMGAFIDQTKDVLIATSEGSLTEDRRVMCRMSFSAIADDGKGDRRTGFHGGGGRVGFGHYDEFSPESVAKEAARMATSQLGAVEAPSPSPLHLRRRHSVIRACGAARRCRSP
ncbi:MAG: DNA gyrase modulator [Myxococcota bacterium]